MDPIDLRDESGTDLPPTSGRLLVAAPGMTDPNFAHTIVLLLDVDQHGVLGVVLNRPSVVPVAHVLDPWAVAVGEPSVLFRGGPVGTDSALAVGTLVPGTEGGPAPVGWRPLFGGTGLVDLDAPLEVVRPALGGLRVFAGYAGWSAGQLEAEILEGGWYVVESAPTDAFSADPAGLWGRVLRRQVPPLSWLATCPEDPSAN